MGIMATYEWEKEVLGEHAEYPGHPVILGTMVMDRYECFEHAAARGEGEKYYNAISDSFIPGAGCAVSSTMSVLKLAIEKNPEAAFAEAERYWKGWEEQSPQNRERAAHGRAQAERAKGMFLARLKAWKAGEVEPSRWRLKR